jgi:hypothetical protein
MTAAPPPIGRLIAWLEDVGRSDSDRDSAELRALFSERDPAVKSTIRSVIAEAHSAGVTVSIRGQAPSDDPEFCSLPRGVRHRFRLRHTGHRLAGPAGDRRRRTKASSRLAV